MKTINIFTKSTFAFLLLGTLTLTACKKEKSTAQDETTTMENTENNMEAQAAFDDVFDNSMGIGAESGEDLGITGSIGIYGRMEGGNYSGRVDSNRCFTITVMPQQQGVFPKTVTIDFGAGCTAPNGRVRKGKIITVFTGKMREPGSKATTTFEGYQVDSMSVTGTHEVVNNSSSSNKIFTIRVIDGKLTWNSGRWVKWNNTRTVTQIEGNGTAFWPLDDVFSITGAGTGENSKGRSWGHEVVEPLIRKFTCAWTTKGVVRISFNQTNGLLDFGNGDCDNKATLTVNGRVKIITLH